MTDISLKRQAETWAKALLSYVQADDEYRSAHKISKASQKRITDLLDLMIRVDRMLEMVGAIGHGWRPDAYKPLWDAVDDLNGRLAQYPSTMHLEFKPDDERLAFFLDSQGSTFGSAEEGLMARHIFNLAEDMLIGNIRECICGRRFYAARSDKRSRSKNCKQKLYEETPEFKEKRRKQMRENYRFHKKGLVKEK